MGASNHSIYVFKLNFVGFKKIISILFEKPNKHRFEEHFLADCNQQILSCNLILPHTLILYFDHLTLAMPMYISDLKKTQISTCPRANKQGQVKFRFSSLKTGINPEGRWIQKKAPVLKIFTIDQTALVMFSNKFLFFIKI